MALIIDNRAASGLESDVAALAREVERLDAHAVRIRTDRFTLLACVLGASGLGSIADFYDRRVGWNGSNDLVGRRPGPRL